MCREIDHCRRIGNAGTGDKRRCVEIGMNDVIDAGAEEQLAFGNTAQNPLPPLVPCSCTTSEAPSPLIFLLRTKVTVSDLQIHLSTKTQKW